MNNIFPEIDFPENIHTELLQGPFNIFDTSDDNKYINKAIMKKRASIWNAYAKENNFATVGSLCVNDMYDPTDANVVVDIIPKGYIFRNGDVATRNYYVTVYLGDDAPNMQPYVLDVQRFLKDGYIGKYQTEMFSLDYHDLVSDNYQEYYKSLKIKAKELNTLLKGEVAVCNTHYSCYNHYFLMRIDDVHVCYNHPGKFIASSKTSRLHSIIKEIPGLRFKWENADDNLPCYVHANKNGILTVRSTYGQHTKESTGFAIGHFIDLEKTGKSWKTLMSWFKDCNEHDGNKFMSIFSTEYKRIKIQ